jgi:hypothetical protein
MKTFDALDEKFDVQPIDTDYEIVSSEPVTDIVVPTIHEDEAERDIRNARTALESILHQGTGAVTSALAIADSSEDPRAYRVVGELLKTVSEVAKELIAAQKMAQEIRKPKAAAAATVNNQQNNFMFAGSTHELMKHLKEITSGKVNE